MFNISLAVTTALPSVSLEELIENMLESLGYGLTDWEVTDDEVRKVVETLEALEDEERGTALRELRKQEKLAKLISETLEAAEQDPELIARLAELLRDQGETWIRDPDALGEDGALAMASLVEMVFEELAGTTGEELDVPSLSRLSHLLTVLSIADSVSQAVQLATKGSQEQKEVLRLFFQLLDRWWHKDPTGFASAFDELVAALKEGGAFRGAVWSEGAELYDALPKDEAAMDVLAEILAQMKEALK